MEKIDIEKIPSVIETNSNTLRFVAGDFIRGIKITEGDHDYIVGQLALNEGISPHKNINGQPDEKEFNLLVNSALLVGIQKIGNPLTITMGFPFSTFQLYKDKCKDLFLKSHSIEFDTAPYTGGGKKRLVAEVDQLAVIPEAIGCSIALRKHENKTGNFFIVSLGYGTCEAIFSTEEGLVQRSAMSTFGIRYAVKLLEAQLSKLYYLDLKNEHHIDAAFRNGFIFLNRRRVDITDLRKKVLNQYYNDVISPGLRKAFDDNDFARSNGIYLAGGGAMFTPLVDEFKNEFDGVIDVFVSENAPDLAAIGYCYNSFLLSGGDKSRAMGMDIGNSSTVICTFSNENI